MLILSRKPGEKIVIDLRAFGLEPVVLTTCEVGQGKVRLGIDADPRVPVHRLEVWQDGEAARKAAGG